MPPRSIRALLVDDEPLALRYLRRQVERFPRLEIVAECADGPSAVAALRQHELDVVFLDVQMPGQNGLEVVRQVGPERMPFVVFVTAYDRYAIDAFDLLALDYLLKPFDAERFSRAVSRLEAALESREQAALARRLGDLLGSRAAQIAADPGASLYLSRVPVKVRGRVMMLSLEEVERFQAADYCVDIHSAGKVYTVRDSLHALERQLDPSQFFRCHRGAIVRLSAIRELVPSAGGDYDIRLHSGATARLSRRRKRALEKVLGRTL